MNIVGGLLNFPSMRFDAAERLALVRCVTGAYVLIYLLPRQRMFASIFEGDPALFDPVGLAHLLNGPLPPDVMNGVYLLTVALAVAFMVGLWFRVTGPALAICLLALLSYRNSWSMILHMHNTLVVHVALLGLAPAADAWSLDSQRGSSYPRRDATAWTALRWIVIVTLVPYFLSGLAKVLGPDGWAWASGSSLRDQVAVNAIRYHVLMDGAGTSLFGRLAEHTWLFTGMGILTFILELGAPLALLHRRAGLAWCVLTFGMHWGIFFVMGIVFRHQMWGVAFLPFVLLCLLRRSAPDGADRIDVASEAARVVPERAT